MKKGGQKQKANRHELQVAELFTKAYYSLGDGEFRRVPMSGGWNKKVAPGDIIAFKYGKSGGDDSDMTIDITFPFSVECKNYRDENVKHFFSGLYSNDSQIFDWMNQAIGDARESGKIALVVFRLFRAKNVAMIRAEDFSKLKELFGEPEFKHYFLRRYLARNTLDTFKQNLLVFCLLKDFLSWIDWGVYKSRGFIRSYVKVDR